MASFLLAIGLLAALIIALLAVPLTIVYSIHRAGDTDGYVRFRWLFGLVRFRVGIPPARKGAPRPKLTSKKKRAAHERTGKGGARGAVALLKQAAFRRRLYRFVRRLFYAVHARNLFLRLRIGLGDPADTGWLWAVIGPIAGIVRNRRLLEVQIEPEFLGPVFEVESHGRFTLVPIQLIALAVAFILSPATFRAWRTLRRGHA